MRFARRPHHPRARRRRLALRSPVDFRRALAPEGPPRAITPLTHERRTSGEQPGAHFGLRLSVVLVVVVGLFATLLIRLWSIQVVSGKHYYDQAADTTTRVVTVAPPRGDILARDGQVLAGEVSTEAVTISRDTAQHDPGVVQRLAALLSVPKSEIDDEVDSVQYDAYEPVPIALGVPSPDVVEILANPQEFPGVHVASQYVRTYPYDALSAQTIGYTGLITSTELPSYARYGYTSADDIGQSGLESEYELQLHGTPGTEDLAVDPLGDVVSTTPGKAPKAGDDVVTNLDLGVDQTLTNALASSVASLRSQGQPAPWAAGVVLQANTGAVLAIASLPSYDDNWWATGSITDAHYQALTSGAGLPLNNYAVSGLQAPGSTFKLASATAALDDGLISPYSTIDDATGCITYGGRQFCDTAESGGAGPLTVTEALTESNDIFFYELGIDYWADQKRYGVDPIQKIAARYGFGENPDIDLPGAASGQVDSPQLRKMQHEEDPAVYPSTYYYGGDNLEMAFGQGETLVTPLQVAEAYATFSNGGVRYAPQLAAGIVSPSGKLVERTAPKVIGKVPYAPGAYAAMLAGFEGVVQSPQGTAYGAFTGFDFNSWDLAGKTGTATVSNNPSAAPTAWFVGFGGPKDSANRYVVAVEVDEAGYGATAAAPVARKVFDYLAAHTPGAVDLPSSASR